MSEVPVVTHDPGCSRLSFSGNDWPETEHATTICISRHFLVRNVSGPSSPAGWVRGATTSAKRMGSRKLEQFVSPVVSGQKSWLSHWRDIVFVRLSGSG